MIEPGTAGVRIRLTAYARRYLRSHRSLRVRVSAAVRQRDGQNALIDRIVTLTR